MKETRKPHTSEKVTIAALRGSPQFQEWFDRFQKHLRLPAALLLDSALVELARAKNFEEPPQR